MANYLVKNYLTNSKENTVNISLVSMTSPKQLLKGDLSEKLIRKFLETSHPLVFLMCYRVQKETSSMKWVNCTMTRRKTCPYSEFLWFLFSRIQTEYGEILSTSPYSAPMREITDLKKIEYGHFSRSVAHRIYIISTKNKQQAYM